MSTYFDECRMHTLAHADALIERIKAKKLNASAFETLMRSFLDRPAYYPEDRGRLLGLALTRFDGRER